MSNVENVSKHQRADRVRHVLLGASLVLGPTFILIASIVRPTVNWSNPGDTIATAVAEGTRWQVANVVELAGFMLLVPGIIAAAELIRSRYPGLALATVALVSASAMMIVGAVFFTMMFAGAKGLNEAAIADYLAATESLPAMLVLLPLFFTAMLGYLLLAYGLLRTKATPVWVPVLFVVSLGAAQFFPDGTAVILLNLGMAIAAAGMAWAYLVGEEDPTPAIAPRVKAAVA